MTESPNPLLEPLGIGKSPLKAGSKAQGTQHLGKFEGSGILHLILRSAGPVSALLPLVPLAFFLTGQIWVGSRPKSVSTVLGAVTVAT